MNILLVDDDRFIIKALQETIHWEALGIEQVYTASSLSQAQAIIQSHPIALMISDIEMPQGSGLDLLAWVRSEKYDIQTIFLTNYADFNYAQKAIELQSFEYYLKPIDPDRLEFIIQKALNKIKRHKSAAQLAQQGQKEAEFWHDYLRKPRPSQAELLLQEVTKRGYSPKPHEDYLLVLITLHLVEEDFHPSVPSWRLQLRHCIKDLSLDFPVHYCALSKIESQTDRYLCLFKKNQTTECADFLKAIQQKIQQDLDRSSILLYSDAISLETLLMKALQLCQYSEEQVFHWDSIHSYASLGPALQKPAHRTSLTFTNQLETEQLLQIIHSLENQDRIPLSALSELQLDWTQQIGIYLDKNGILAHKLFQNKHHQFLFERRFHAIEAFEAYIGDYWSSARHYVIDLEHQSNLIQRITDYIDHHYKEDISRTKLAEMVFLSPDHLARMFKRDTGETLVKYITDKRMAAAKEMLSQSDTPIYQVALQVGYDNYSYFTKAFKQKVGLSPGDYRKQCQEAF